MSWCPKCKSEYQEGYTICCDCGSELTEGNFIAEDRIYTGKIIKAMEIVYVIYRGVILLLIPSLIMLSLSICLSEYIQKLIIPNPTLSRFDEMQRYTLYFGFYNYIFLYINYLTQKKIPQLKRNKVNIINLVYRFYFKLTY